MTSDALIKAILSMDSYNRGYDEGIILTGDTTKLGTATLKTRQTADGTYVTFDSTTLLDTNGNNNIDQPIGFYALAYEYDSDGDGTVDETIISYRGTNGGINQDDVINGWGLGRGSHASPQGEMAIKFFNEVAGNPTDPRTSNIDLVGHSLGGGLAGHVAGLYGKNANIYDSMAFQNGTNLLRVRADTNTISSNYKQAIYGSHTPWNTDFSKIDGYYINGEALGLMPRSGDTEENVFDLNDGGTLNAIDKHSMATLVIRMFADESEMSELSNWTYAEQYFWPDLYDDSFAIQTGVLSHQTNGNNTIQGELRIDNEYADILRTIIAYSALDTGELPFGNTAIRAMYNDANDLGSAITDAGNDSLIEVIATDISKLYVHFAAQLSLNDIVASANSSENRGTIFYNNGLLTLSVEDQRWSDLLKSENHRLEQTKFDLISSVISNAPELQDLGGAVRNLWGVNFQPNVETITINVTDVNWDYSLNDLGANNYQFYLGGSGIDNITASHGHDLVSGGDGNDQIHGGDGNDILSGGDGEDIILGNLGNDYLYGGALADDLYGNEGDDYLYGGDGDNYLDGGIGVDHIYGGKDVDVISGGDGADQIFGYESDDIIWGGSGNDKLYGGQGSDTYVFNANEGTNIIREISGSMDILEFGNGMSVSEDNFNFIGCTLVISANGTTIRIDGQKEGSSTAVEYYTMGGAVYELPYCEEEEDEPNDPNNPDLPDGGPNMPLPGNMPSDVISPLVFDLDADGVELTELGTYNTYFDLRGNGQAVLTGWVSPDDGLLAIDKNGDEIINDIHELFGNETTDGFNVLRDYDTNGDNLINTQDAVFKDLLIWQDLNSDGQSQTQELKTIAEWGITSIDLAAARVDGEIAGNPITHLSSYTTTNGQTHNILDVWFNYNTRHTQNTSEYDLDHRVTSMPALKGFGDIKDMHIALSLDNDETDPASLMSLMMNFNNGRGFVDYLSNWEETKLEVRDILLRWAGVDNTIPTSRGGYVDARHLEFYEAFNGFDFIQYGSSNARPNSGAYIEEIFDYLVEYSMIQLIGQIDTSSIFTDAFYSLGKGEMSGNMTISQEILEALSNNLNNSQDWVHYAQFLAYTRGLDSLSTTETTMLDNVISSQNYSNVDHWGDILSIRNAVHGILITQPENWQYWRDLKAQTSDANIYGTNGNDILIGSGFSNADIFYGYDGDDTYIYNGDTDIYSEQGGGGFDTISYSAQTQYTANYFLNTNASYIFRPEIIGNDLKIGGIVIDNYFATDRQIERLYFEYDGSEILIENMPEWIARTNFNSGFINITETNASRNYTLLGTDANDEIQISGPVGANISSGGGYDVISGTESNDIITTGYGDDIVYGNGGDDNISAVGIIYGGEGNDIINTLSGANIKLYNQVNHIYGGEGNDTITGSLAAEHYYWEIGDGNDVITETMVGSWSSTIDNLVTDTLHIGSGLTLADINFKPSRLTNDLMIEIGNETITLKHFKSAADQDYLDENGDPLINYYVDQIQFDDGSVYSIKDNLIYYYSSGDDDINGFSASETIYAGAGNDYIILGAGDDVVYDGLGNDVMISGEGNNTFVLSKEAGSIDRIHDFNPNADKIDLINFASDNISFLDIWNSITINGNWLQINLPNNQILRLPLEIYGELIPDNFKNVSISELPIIEGNEGNDILTGTSSGDIIRGLSGDDILRGLQGTDFLYGGLGNDIVVDNYGTNYLYGNTGNNLLATSSDENYLYGGDESDVIYSLSNWNLVSGGDGNDTLYTHRYWTDLEGGEGDDLIIHTSNFSGQDWGINGSNIYGNNGNDFIIAYDTENYISSGSGDDYIMAQSSYNQINGGEGEDTFIFSKNSQSYSISVWDVNYSGVTDTSNSDWYSLNEVEYLRFTDGTFDVATQVFTLYQDQSIIAKDDEFTVDIDTKLLGNVFADNGDGIDLITDDRFVSYSENYMTAMGGYVALQSNGDFIYTPQIGFTGIDSFEYILLDGKGGSDTGSVTITVDGVTSTEPDPIEIIVDNTDAGQTSRTGSWTSSTWGNYHDTNALWSLSPGSIFTWNPDIAQAGEYDVSAWWLSSNERTSSAVYEIHHMNGVSQILMDQKSGGNQWNGLGIYEFNDASYVTVSTTDTNYLSADAVKFVWMGESDEIINVAPVAQSDVFITDEDEVVIGNLLIDNGNGFDSDADSDDLSIESGTYVTAQGGTVYLNNNGDFTYTPLTGYYGSDSFEYTLLDGKGGSDTGSVAITINEINSNEPEPFEIIVDNADIEQTSQTGSWTSSTWGNYHDTNALWSFSSGSTFTWNPDISQAGEYDVSAWWLANDNRTNNALYEIHHMNGVTQIVVDQRANGSLWNGLGIYELDDASYVTVSTVETKHLSADAMKFVWVGSIEEPSVWNALNFNDHIFTSYESGQDEGVNPLISADGSEIEITGNAWKKIDLNYTVTEDTYVQFDYRSTIEGELQGFVLDSDNAFSTGPRVIQLYGTDNNSSFDRTYNYNGSGDWQSFTIKMSDYVTGAINNLGFVNDHDSSPKNANSLYRNFTIFEQHEGEPQLPNFNVISMLSVGTAESIDLTSYVSSAYDPGQQGVINTLDIGVNNILLEGNLWHKLDLGSYFVGSDTILEFDYRSSDQGEVSGIGFDTDNTASSSKLIQLGGSQANWASHQEDYDGNGDWQSYRVTLGDMTSGHINYLTFASDHDVSMPTASSEFANIKLYEDTNGDIDSVFSGTNTADLFDINELPAFEQYFQIDNFDVNNDVIDIADILGGYDPLSNSISDFVQILDDGVDTHIALDQDGQGSVSSFQNITKISNIAGEWLDLNDMISQGNLII